MQEERGIVAEFKTLYAVHYWLRCVTWMALLSVGLFLLIADGFPPRVWQQLLWTAFWLPRYWRLAGARALLALLEPFAWSVVWLSAWIFCFWTCFTLLRCHRKLVEWKAQQWSSVWVPSHNLSLAMSLPTGQMLVDDTLAISIPRLRLPQKSMHPTEASVQMTGVSSESAYLSIQDVPTRPAAPIIKKNSPLFAQPLQVGVGWHMGIARRNEPNEDGLCVLQATCTYEGKLVPFGLFVIADGMGGHEGGQEASRLAVQCMMHTVLQNIMLGNDLSADFLADMLVGGVEWSNLAVYQHARVTGKDMGTTLTAVLVVGKKAYVVNVGDSRTYLFREGTGLQQITRDHSLVASLVVLGQIKPEEVYTHPERNKIYRSLGHSEDVKIDSFTVDLYAYDRLLLCSDGLWEMVRDPQLERILRSSDDPTCVCDSMVQAALRGGGADNVSAIVVQVPRVL